MSERRRWRQALMISVAVHAVVLVCLSWGLSGAFDSQRPQEEFVELELISQAEPAAVADGLVDGGADAGRLVSPAGRQLTGNEVPQVAAPSSGLSVLSAAVPAVGSGISGNGAGTAVGSKGGSTGSGGTASDEGTGSSGGYISPSVVSTMTPRYPEEARRQGIEGTVVLKIRISTSGAPGSVEIYRSSGNASLDAAAVNAVWQWQFSPARSRDTGEAVTCITTLPVAFSLD